MVSLQGTLRKGSMSETEYKKYDSDSRYTNYSARLAKDAEVRETPGGTMVRITFVDTSKAEGDEDVWIDATPQDHQTEMAKFLRKGDVVPVDGRLTVRKGKSGDKLFFNLRRATIHLTPALIGALKERGFVPGTKANGNGNGHPPAKAPAKAPAKRVVNLDEDE